jgi:hypothetical protein
MQDPSNVPEILAFVTIPRRTNNEDDYNNEEDASITKRKTSEEIIFVPKPEITNVW